MLNKATYCWFYFIAVSRGVVRGRCGLSHPTVYSRRQFLDWTYVRKNCDRKFWSWYHWRLSYKERQCCVNSYGLLYSM